MTHYSFLSEADTYIGGQNFFKDAYQAAKFGVGAGIDSAKEAIGGAAKKMGLDQFAKKHPKIYKSGNVVAAAGSAGYSYYLAIMNGLMAKKVSTLIRDLQDPDVDTRTKAVSLFVNLGYVKDDLIDIGNVRSVSVNYEVSSKIAGPVIQIIKNPADPEWKLHAIQYLKRQRMYMLVKAGAEPVIGTVAAAGISKYLKK